MMARERKTAKQIQVMRFRVASALLALLNIELPLAASPPIPPPLGLWSRTSKISNKPVATQVQDRMVVNMAKI